MRAVSGPEEALSESRPRRHPLQSLAQTLSSEGTAGLYVPGVVLDGAQGEVIGDLCRRHAILHVLLVRKY